MARTLLYADEPVTLRSETLLIVMPELPEVETVRRGLSPFMEDRKIERVVQNRPDLRFPFPAQFKEKLEGKTLVSLSRRAKYLVGELEDGTILIMHLGMSGSFRVEGGKDNALSDIFHHERNKSTKHDHVALHMSGGICIIYNDPRRFGFMDLTNRRDLTTCKHFRHMGVEPTGNALSADYVASAFRNKKTPLKSALLDQKIIAGLGNIYVCEALWRAGLSPEQAAGTLVTKKGKPTKRCIQLTQDIRDVIADAIAAGGSSLRDYVHTDGSLGYFQHSFAVYGREGEACRRTTCTGVINRMVQSGRSTFYCPGCQG